MIVDLIDDAESEFSTAVSIAEETKSRKLLSKIARQIEKVEEWGAGRAWLFMALNHASSSSIHY